MTSHRGLKIGVVGAGVMGKNHARVLASLPGIKLVGVADVDALRAEEIGKLYKTDFFSDYHDLLPLVDAVCLSTPTKTHFDLAFSFISAKKHIFIEKPFTGSSATAKELIAHAKENGVVLQVGLIEHFNPAFTKLKKLIEGEKILGVDIKRLSPFPERITDTDVVFDMMLHDLDLLLNLVPEEISGLHAKGEKIRSKMLDRVIATFNHVNGVVARIEASRVFSTKTRKIAVTTDRSFFDADLIEKKIYIRDFSSPTPSTVPVKANDQITDEFKNFLSSIKNNSQPLVSGHSALAAIILAEEVLKAC